MPPPAKKPVQHCFVFAWTPFLPDHANSICILNTNAAFAAALPDWIIDLRFTELPIPPGKAIADLNLAVPPNLRIGPMFPSERPLSHGQIADMFYGDAAPESETLRRHWLAYWKEQFSNTGGIAYTRNAYVYRFLAPIRNSIRAQFLEVHQLKYLRKVVAGTPHHSIAELKRVIGHELETEFSRIRLADFIFCISQPIARKIKKRFPEANLSILRSGFTPSPDLPAAVSRERDIDLLYSGQLYQWKGVSTIIDALRYCDPKIRLTIVGGNMPDELYYYQQYARHLGVSDRISWEGQVPHHKVAGYQRRARIGLIPLTFTHRIARWYTSPIKVFELMSAGAALIVSDLPSMRDILKSGVTAEFAPWNDAKEWGRKIDLLIANDEYRSQLASNGLQLAAEFTYARRGERIRDEIWRYFGGRAPMAGTDSSS